jgi:alkylation response protein AidB-like acyl-CoA dehydrogenase
MDFDFTEDQHEIKRTARDLLAKRSGWPRVREQAEAGRYDEALWGELCELGWPGIAIGEEHGGAGLGVVELVVLAEELGYASAAVPLLGTATAALLIDRAGSDAQKERWLSGLATGELRGAVGARDFLPDGDGADVVVVLDGGSALVGSEGIRPLETIDPTRRYGRVADLAAFEPLPGGVAESVDRAAVATSAELVGLSQRALDMTVAYVKERKQFGTPVGAFQAVSHKCAGMLLATEGARSATYYGAWAADAAPARLAEAAALAKAAASEAACQVTGDAIQAHGGIGFTWEADVHWLFKRAQLSAQHLGGGREHRARLASLAAAGIVGPVGQ